MTTATQTLTEQFAAAQRENLVPAILKTIRTVRRVNTAIVFLAMAVSYLHQATYLADIGAGSLGYLVPLVFDLMIVACVKVTQTPGLVAKARHTAMAVLAPMVLVSGTVNFVAPGSMVVRCVFAIVVATIAAAELLAAAIKPDFAAIERTVAEVAAPAVTSSARSEAARKAAATRRANADAARKAADDKAAKAADRREQRRLDREIAELEAAVATNPGNPSPVSSAPASR